MKKYILILVLLLFVPALMSTFSRDASVYAYMGSLLLESKIPYIDGWDHKGISLYLINALGYLIGFKNYIGIRILELLLIGFSFIQIFKSLTIRYSKKMALLAVTFGLLTLRYFFDGGNLTEEYGALFVLLSLALVLKKEMLSRDWVIIGALFVINFTIRANLISFWIALFFTLIYTKAIQEKTPKKLLTPLLYMGIGTLTTVGILAIYFIITNSFNEFYHAAFTYNFSYSKQSVTQVVGSIIKSTRRYEVSLLLIITVLISIVSFIKKKHSFIGILLLLWIPIELYFGNMSGKLFAHYYMMWVPIIVLATVYIIDYFKGILLQKEQQFIVLITAVFLFFQIPIFNVLGSYKQLLTKSNPTKNEAIAAHINAHYAAETILVWGNESAIYNLTKKYTTVPYFYQTLFKIKSSLTEGMIAEFTEKIKKSPPHIIVDTKTKSLLFLDESNRKAVSKNQLEQLKDYFDFVHKNYELKESVAGADFYMLK